jgi:predicted nucleic-acid-binding protein
MIGLDTNVLLRVALGDHQGQADAARALILAEQAQRTKIFVNRIVLCEAVWTLSRGYRYSREQLAAALALWLGSTALVIENRVEVEIAASRLGTSQADFSDMLVGLINERAGCTATYSFDEAAIKAGVFTAVPGA